MGIPEPSLLLFFGRLHPLVLHFPVAILIVVVIIEIFARFRGIGNNRIYQSTIFFILVVGACSAVVTVAMGWFLASHGGYEGDTIYWHKRFGIAVALLSILAVVLKRLSYQKAKPLFNYAYIVVLALCVNAIFMAGHYGGMLTHGDDFLSGAAPEPIATWLVKGKRKEDSKSKIGHSANDTFTSKIEPMLKHYCYQCHGESKQQGGLKLSEQDMAYAGGDSGIASISPGSALNSEVIRRLFMLRENKKAMPPDGKPRPSAEELVTLMDWIESGAPWAGESNGPKAFLADLLGVNAKPANAEAIEVLRKAGASVKTISNTNPLLMVNLSLHAYSSEQLNQLLTPLKYNIAWLNLSNNQISKQSSELLSEFSHLTQLTLSNSGLNDDSIRPLAQLENLAVLNLTSNDVSIDGASEVIDLPHLERLYLWQNPINTEQFTQLGREYPDVQIIANTLLIRNNDPVKKLSKSTGKTSIKTSSEDLKGGEL